MEKKELAVLKAYSLRSLVDKVNQINQGENKILKEDVVCLMKEDDSYSFVYYK